jgi:hypothetical protein
MTKLKLDTKVHGVVIGALILIQNFLIIAKIGAKWNDVFNLTLFEVFLPVITYVAAFTAFTSAFLIRGLFLAYYRQRIRKK